MPIRLLIGLLAAALSACAALPTAEMPSLVALTQPPPPICQTDPTAVQCLLLTGAPLYVQTPDTKVAYQVFGHGPPLVLVHGWPLNRYTWRNLLPLLANQFTVYAFDIAGAGDTVWTEATDFSWPGQGKTLKAALDALKLPPYLVFAQDSGAVIARELALLDGARVLKLAMANTEIPHHRPPQALVDAQSKMSLPPAALVGWLLRRKFADAEFLQTTDGFGDSFTDPSYVLGDFSKYVLAPIVQTKARSEGHRRFLAGWDWAELDSLKARHATLTMPVLLIWGEDDRTFPLAQAEEMKTQFPNCVGLVRVPKGRLLIHEDHAPEVAAALLGFFAAVP